MCIVLFIRVHNKYINIFKSTSPNILRLEKLSIYYEQFTLVLLNNFCIYVYKNVRYIYHKENL